MKHIRKENDPTECLRPLKVHFSRTFQVQYFQSIMEKRAAYNLCLLLRKPVETTITDSLGQLIADEMKMRRFALKTQSANYCRAQSQTLARVGETSAPSNPTRQTHTKLQTIYQFSIMWFTGYQKQRYSPCRKGNGQVSTNSKTIP